MRWIVLVVLALLAAAPAQAISHDNGDQNVTVEAGDDPDNGQTQGAGRGDGGNGIATPWAVLVALGVLVVAGVVAALFLAARGRH